MTPAEAMNWKLILQLSMFGLAMGVATSFVVASSVEPYCWLVIFIICAYLIIKRTTTKRFLHGMVLGVVNGGWVAAAHVVFVNRYLESHFQQAQMVSALPASPQLMMAMVGLIYGFVSGAMIGIFVLVMSKLLPPQPVLPNLPMR